MNKYLKIFLFGFSSGSSVRRVHHHLPDPQSNRPLFESIMPVTVTLCVVVFAILYSDGQRWLRARRSRDRRGGLIINLAIDRRSSY